MTDLQEAAESINALEGGDPLDYEAPAPSEGITVDEAAERILEKMTPEPEPEPVAAPEPEPAVDAKDSVDSTQLNQAQQALAQQQNQPPPLFSLDLPQNP